MGVKAKSGPSLFSASIDGLLKELARVRDGDFDFLVHVPERNRRTQQLAKLINVVLGEVRRADDRTLQAQKRLAAAVAHELNNPLGVVKSTSETLSTLASRMSSELSDTKESEQRDAVVNELCRSISSASERMERVIARMERFTNLGGAVVQAVNLNELLSDVIAISAAQLRGKPKVKLDLKALPPITCRPAQLTVVFASLLDNAIEAVGPEGSVGVSSVANDRRAEVRIEDSGPDLSADQLASIFEPSFQVVADRVSTGNWSLFSARRVVHQHDGQIRADSVKDRGTVVTVTLPLKNNLGKPSVKS